MRTRDDIKVKVYTLSLHLSCYSCTDGSLCIFTFTFTSSLTYLRNIPTYYNVLFYFSVVVLPIFRTGIAYVLSIGVTYILSNGAVDSWY